MGESTVNIYIYLLFIYDPASQRNLAECDYDPGMPKVFGVDLSRLHTSEKTFVSLKKNVLFWIWQTVKKSGLQWHKENRMALSNLSHKFKFAGLVSVSKSVLLFNGYPLLLSFSCLLETGQKSVCICFATYSLYSLLPNQCIWSMFLCFAVSQNNTSLDGQFEKPSSACVLLVCWYAMECNSLESCPFNHTKYKVNMSISFYLHLVGSFFKLVG